MKSCLFILIAAFILAGVFASLGTIFLISSDTNIAKQEKSEETTSEE